MYNNVFITYSSAVYLLAYLCVKYQQFSRKAEKVD